ncbi:MAG: PTS fructose transporter subunit EIIBC [Tistrella sp.]|uniref:protein-N(pi)-phosphohistidine--D-fructose phosphotransferase n=1 Tax=Tistrella mobilis TaxID=171437 RepID=A0A3B9IU20_9PROT|nr:PTS fructose transporter subunit EIIBC [Tistrella sp.]HAE50847.1 PTS fructose transporter subunit EIIBC [Tistrella mobilis]
MSKLVAVITAEEAGTERLGTRAVLAAEALRKHAHDGGHAIAIEFHDGETARDVLEATAIAGADAVLAVGGSGSEPRFAGKAVTTAAVDEVLRDPAAVLARALAGDAVPASASSAAPAGGRRIVAITSCPTGIAHTFMAAEGILQAAKALGHEARVETQGSVGARDGLTAEEIRAADLVIIAADTQVDLSRFDGKRVYLSGTKPAINDGQGLINRAFAEAKLQGKGAAAPDDAAAAKAAAGQGSGRTGPYRHLMTGVSFMLPFVTTGGLLIAIAFALGGIYAYEDANQGTLAYALFQIGAKGAFALMVPALAGYIAYSVADRPGIAPGMIGGMIATQIGAGFLGGIVAGFIAGYGTAWLNRNIRLHKNLEGLKPVLILPILGSLLTGLLMLFVVGEPVAQLLATLSDWLRNMQGGSAILLGLIIGLMMAFDMGGPVNKAAYAFSTGLIASEIYGPMAAAMAAGMTPPLGIALATKLFPGRFTGDEREAGNAAAVLGLAFISEGAIPFAARDPFRVIPSLMVGSGLAGAISMAVGAQLKVPHGGIFVLPIPNAVVSLGGYLVALIAGTVVTAITLRILKKPVAKPAAPAAV